MSSILDRELIVITGKGGVGRSSVAAAIGLAAAGPERSVMVCETAGQSAVPSIFGRSPGPPGSAVGLADGLAATTIDPDAALREWMSSQVGAALSRVLGGSRSFGQFIAAAPGARELVTITKAWELGPGRSWQRTGGDHQTVILDAPATGHGVAMLRAPRTFADIAGTGPIHDQAEKVWQLLSDPGRSAIVAVTLPAELPVGETLDLSGWVRGTLGRGLDAVVVNRCCSELFTEAELARISDLAGGGSVPPAALSLAEGTAARAEAERRLIDELAGASELMIEIPEEPADVPAEGIAKRISAILAEELG